MYYLIFNPESLYDCTVEKFNTLDAAKLERDSNIKSSIYCLLVAEVEANEPDIRERLAVQAEQIDRLADAVPSANAHADTVRAYLKEQGDCSAGTSADDKDDSK